MFKGELLESDLVWGRPSSCLGVKKRKLSQKQAALLDLTISLLVRLKKKQTNIFKAFSKARGS